MTSERARPAQLRSAWAIGGVIAGGAGRRRRSRRTRPARRARRRPAPAESGGDHRRGEQQGEDGDLDHADGPPSGRRRERLREGGDEDAGGDEGVAQEADRENPRPRLAETEGESGEREDEERVDLHVEAGPEGRGEALPPREPAVDAVEGEEGEGEGERPPAGRARDDGGLEGEGGEDRGAAGAGEGDGVAGAEAGVGMEGGKAVEDDRPDRGEKEKPGGGRGPAVEGQGDEDGEVPAAVRTRPRAAPRAGPGGGVARVRRTSLIGEGRRCARGRFRLWSGRQRGGCGRSCHGLWAGFPALPLDYRRSRARDGTGRPGDGAGDPAVGPEPALHAPQGARAVRARRGPAPPRLARLPPGAAAARRPAGGAAVCGRRPSMSGSTRCSW